MLQVIEPEPGQPVLVRDDQDRDTTLIDVIHQRQEFPAPQVHPAARLLYHLIHRQATGEAELPHRRDLRCQIIFLAR